MTKFLGIEWAPLNIPLERRLQTAAVCLFIYLFTICSSVCYGIVIFLIGWTQYGWLLVVTYGLFRYYDAEKTHKGGRPIEWVKNWKVWKYFADYFPIHVVKTADLDPSRNYIMGYHPHGIITMSCFGGVSTNARNWGELFPGIKRFPCTLTQNFRPPFQREFIMACGAIDVSKDSIRHVLNNPKGGHAVVIVIGGAQEALDARPGTFRLTIESRKGFAKMALTTGSDLVPIFCFGENDIYDQIENPEGSFLRKLQQFYKKMSGFTPPLFHGRGVFNYTAGIVPYRRPLNVVVGKPIRVEKVAEPTQEQIVDVHRQYLDGLKDLFESNKTKYGISEQKHLIFV